MSLELTSYSDHIQPFLIHHSQVRGRLVRLQGSINQILTQHDYPPLVSQLLGELCVVAALLSSNLKGSGKLILQLRGRGDIQFLVADITAEGAMRGYAEFSQEVDFSRKKSDLRELMGEGYLAITFDKGDKPYQGIVELDGESLSECLGHYFTHSEQTDVFIKSAVSQIEVAGQMQWVGGGLLLQHVATEGGINGQDEHELPATEEEKAENWRRNAILAETVKPEELLDIFLSPQALLYRLYNEDGVWVYDAENLRAECSCSRERFAAALKQFPEAELVTMLSDEQLLEANCQFCNQTESFTLEQLKQTT